MRGDVVLDKVTKRYPGGVVAADAIDLHIADGELVVLVGPSGCGKTTVLRMIAGLEEISEGTLTIGGRVMNGVPPRDRDIAMVFQSYALYPHMSVRENMAFGLRLRKTPKPEIGARVDEVARTLGLSELLDRKPKALSGGQRQRVAMGRAIVRHPSVFLFDEPLSNLDAKLRVQMRVEIAALHRRVGATMVYVTHDQVEAMTLADRIVVMSAGKVQQIDRPLDVYHQPKNHFVAGFIGSPAMNFVDGALATEHGDLVFHAHDLRVTLSAEQAARIRLAHGLAAKVTLGVRPQHLHRTDDSLHAVARGTVRHVERMGVESFAHVAVADVTLIVELPGDSPVAVGDLLAIGLDPRHVHVFDPGGANLTLPPGALSHAA